MTTHRLAATAVAGALMLLVTGCAGTEPAAGDPTTDTSTAGGSWAERSVGPVVLKIPEDWTELSRSDDGASGVTTATFGLPDDGSTVRPGITVSIQEEPTRDASAEAESLVLGERAQRGAEDVEVAELVRSDAELAVGVSLWNEQRSAEGPVEVASRWVVADLAGGEQVVVGVLGPKDEFAELPLDEVLDAVELAPESDPS
ncbi:hypothetical protein [Isoptericola croceus]|uniref:hypothetical protein n=1 Tax=Isoptericola croceus TaxID=3031406 RepID=UPI0023F9094B|nr:hypothetical protein [Isoptericola croceus]